MQKYVLTEKGKWVVVATIAMLFAVVLLFVFAVTWDGGPDESTAKAVDSDFQKDDDRDSPEPAATPSSLVRAAVLDADAGVLTFPLAADLPMALEDDIVSLIGLLLESPKNTEDSKIAVDIPQLPDEHAVVLTSALIDAFATCDVPLSRIVFFVYRVEEGAEVFEVAIGFRGS